MKNKKTIASISVIVLALILAVIFLNQEDDDKVIESLVNVRVLEIETSTNQEQMKFVGFIQPNDLFEATFSTVGTIKNIHVSVNQQVKKDDVLATIDDESAQANLKNAQESYSVSLANQRQAKALMDAEAANVQNEKDTIAKQREQASNQVNDLTAQVEQAKKTLEEVSQDAEADSQEVLEAETNLLALEIQLESATTLLNDLNSEDPASISIAQSRYDAALAAYQASTTQTTIAQNNVVAAQQQVDQARLLSQIEGTVVAVVQSEGELATPLIPTVVVASNEKVAVFGLSQSNVNRVLKDMIATIESDEETFEGFVSDVSLLPDEVSRTYEAKVNVGIKDTLNIGETVSVIINLQETEGIWIDLSILKNDGEDYVFVVEDNRVSKKVVERLAMQNNLVLVSNLEKNDRVIIEGYQRVKVGDKVNIIEDTYE